jgi:hypothetical protein
MTRLQLFMAVAVPIVGAVHRYAASYGYRGKSPAESFTDALQVLVMLQLAIAVTVCVSMLMHGGR